MREIPIALVGCGWISEAHARGYRALHEAGCRLLRVTVCCDANPETARRRAEQIAAFQGTMPAVVTDIAALARSGLAEAADICLPHCFHHAAAIALLDAGMHVIVEKPLGITVRASRAIIAAGRRNGRIVATAENTRRHIGSRAAAWAVRSGLIGTPIGATTLIAGWAPIDLADPKWAWRSAKAINGGGMLIDGGAHYADMAMRLFGDPVEITCRTRRLAPAVEVVLPVVGPYVTDAEDWWQASIRFANGAVAVWTVSQHLPGADQRLSIWHGSAGTLSDGSWPLHPFESGATLRDADGTRTTEELEARYLASLDAAQRERLFPFGIRDSFGIELWDFADSIAQGRTPEMDGEAGLRAKALCLACYESAELGGAPVAYEDVLAGRVDAYQRPLDRRWGLLAAEAQHPG